MDFIVNQDYEEANTFTNSVAAIPAGQDGQWDFALVDNSATEATSYCFRVVKSDGTVLDTYSVIPEISTNAAPRRKGGSGSYPSIYSVIHRPVTVTRLWKTFRTDLGSI